ncbi:hypothetical protein ACNS7O_06045 [Haloferacaceae archaeon DSL9]
MGSRWDETRNDAANGDDERGYSPPEDAIEPPNQKPEGWEPRDAKATEPTETETDEEVGDRRGYFDADVDSRWWYWIAAVPVYAVVSAALSIVLAFAFGFGILLDIGGAAGIGTLFAVVMSTVLGGSIFVAGAVLAVAFPVAIYVDSKAIAADPSIDWDPDAVLYVILAAATVLTTAFALSVVVALYYLYRRHKTIGVP